METYKGVRVAGARETSEAGVPHGPDYKGLPRGAVEEHPELAWMLEAEEDVLTAGSEEGEIVWVLADRWDEWVEASEEE